MQNLIYTPPKNATAKYKNKKRTCLNLDKFDFFTSNYFLISLTFAALPVLARK